MIRLAVRVSREQAEVVLAELLELAPGGVEEVQGDGATVEYAVYGAPGELPALPDLHALAGDALVEISTSEILDDWHERWRQFHRPVLIEAPSALVPVGAGRALSPCLYVRPPWEAPRAPRQDSRAIEEIVIDPGQAFGTGAHASTRLCLELLLAMAGEAQPRGALLDVGTGSGVLAIAAARLGFRPVLALDNEQESVDASAENARVNGAEIEVRSFDLRSQKLPWMDEQGGRGHPPVVLANLLRPLLLELARAMPREPTHLIAGGLLTEEVDEIVAAFTRRFGLRERARRAGGEWSAVWLSAL